MNIMNKILIIILVIIIFIAIYYFFFYEKLNQRFYDYKQVFPFLEKFKHHNEYIKYDVLNIIKNDWKSWPEKYLYNNEDGWKVFPFYGFNIWIDENCKKCPTIYKLLKTIPGLRTASLSRLRPDTKLIPHQGWAELSNNVLRCHYGIFVKDNCIIGCENEITEMRENEIIVFDDSKIHYAENNGNQDRIVLILDIDRPHYIEKGKSSVKNTTELLHFIDIFKK